MRVRNSSVVAGDGLFRQLSLDILASESSRAGSASETTRVKQVLNDLIDRYC